MLRWIIVIEIWFWVEFDDSLEPYDKRTVTKCKKSELALLKLVQISNYGKIKFI